MSQTPSIVLQQPCKSQPETHSSSQSLQPKSHPPGQTSFSIEQSINDTQSTYSEHSSDDEFINDSTISSSCSSLTSFELTNDESFSSESIHSFQTILSRSSSISSLQCSDTTTANSSLLSLSFSSQQLASVGDFAPSKCSTQQ